MNLTPLFIEVSMIFKVKDQQPELLKRYFAAVAKGDDKQRKLLYDEMVRTTKQPS